MSGDTLFTALKLNLCYFPHAALVWNREEGKKQNKTKHRIIIPQYITIVYNA